MADWNETQRSQQNVGSVPRSGRNLEEGMTFDEGLRKHMLGVYNYMASAVLLTAVVSMIMARSGLVDFLVDPVAGPSLLYWASVALPFVLVMWLQFRIFKMSVFAAQVSFWTYAVLTGISISFIFLLYTPVSIAQTFFATAAAFAGLSLWGYTTKKDMSGWGSFLIMGIWGMFAATLLNVLVFESGMFDLIASAIMIVLFSAFTAYKTQETKNIYMQLQGNAEMLKRATIYGALHLYMAFIAIFMNLLRFMGSND